MGGLYSEGICVCIGVSRLLFWNDKYIMSFFNQKTILPCLQTLSETGTTYFYLIFIDSYTCFRKVEGLNVNRTLFQGEYYSGI